MMHQHIQQTVELIMESSNAVLFRRLASNDPKKRKMVYVSPNISRFGYEADDFISGKVMFRDLVYPDDSPRTLREIQKFTQQGREEYTQFYRIVTRSGEVRWVEDRTSVYEDERNGARYHQGIVIDIHDKKIIEDKLKKSEEKHRRIIETTTEGFLFLNNDNIIVDLNPAYERLSGSSRTKILGRKPDEIAPDISLHLKQAGTNLKPEKFEGVLTTFSGKKIPILIHLGPLTSDLGNPLGAAVFITDISYHKKALNLAAEVQQSLLPLHPPQVSGLDIAGTGIPCDEVGGDFYDYLQNDNNAEEVTVVVGDVSGHGVDAALLMSSARSYLRAYYLQRSSPEEIVTSLNKHITQDMIDSGRFMTLFYLILPEDRLSIEWIRAGHDPALLYDPVSDSFTELKGPGIAIGVEASVTFCKQHIDISSTKGQILILGTDGVWEAVNGSGEMFGKNRLKDIVRSNHMHRAEKIVQEIISTHCQFTAGTITADDLTILIIKL